MSSTRVDCSSKETSPVGDDDIAGGGRLNGVEIPLTWALTSIENVARVGTGTTPRRGEGSYWESGTIPWVVSAAVNEEYVTEGSELVTSNALQKTSLKLYPRHTLIMALYGEGKTRGKVSELLIDATINQALAAIQLDIDDEKFRGFVKWFLHSNYEEMRSRAAGGNQPNLNLGIVKSLQIPVAPLAEQTRIVQAIESLQERSSRTRALLAEVKPLIAQLRQSVLRSAFSGRLTADWRAKQNTETEFQAEAAKEQTAPAYTVAPTASAESTTGSTNKTDPPTQPHQTHTNGSPQSTDTKFETATELLQRIRTERRQRWEAAQLAAFEAKGKKPTKGWQDKYKEPEPVDDSELPELPEGWCWTNMNELSHWAMYGPRFSSDAYEDNGALVLRTTDFSDDGSINLDTPPQIPLDAETLEKYRVNKGDLLITRTGSLGTLAVYPGGADAIAGAFLIHFRLAAAIELSWWVFYYLKGPYGQRYLIEKGTGTGRPNLNMPSINSIPIPLAPHSELMEILEKLSENSENVDAVSALASTVEQSLTQLDQSILSKAFKGELVPQDPNDEPASELLARIRATREADLASKKSSKKKAVSKKKKKQPEKKKG